VSARSELRLLPWVVVAANAAVLGAALALPSLVLPLAGLALFVALAAVFAARLAVDGEAKPSLPNPGGDGPDNYELRKPLASGTMGEVWLARHRQLGRDVALKRIKPGHIDEEDTRRFVREARVLSALRSPHTVEVFDFGVQNNGELFYAMELLDGVDLQTAIREYGPIPPERVVHLLLQACASLQEAHDQGLVHRDIKPANFMICRYGGEFDFLKILDFGLVKKPLGRGSHAGITRAATVLGTPAYVAPESLNGSKFVDRRADLYALGAIGFFLLTGRLVFDHDKPMAMVRAHLSETPPAPSTHSRFQVPAELDQLILACLAKSPDERPPDATAVRARLEQVPLVDPWNQARAAAWWNEQIPTDRAERPTRIDSSPS
jgi:eukaryotic-like serine/threonine-protein kinase